MAPAIKLAEDGFVLTRADTDIIDAGAALSGKKRPGRGEDLLQARRLAAPARRPAGAQPDLANTLEAIAKDGPDAFYKGPVAQKVEAAMKAGGGIMTAQDFAGYTVTESPPVTCSYRGYAFASSPPPSSGGTTLCEILNILEGYDMKALGFHSAASIHVMVEAMRHAYFDRNTYLGDPGFVKNPLDRLLSKDYAAQIRAKIEPDKATPSKDVQPGIAPHEKPETTHYSVVDKDGNAVSVTYTINGLFGAGVMAPGTGYMLNDEMDDFTVKPGVPNLFGLVQGAANSIAPGKRPLSSMAPTLVTKDGQGIVLVLGSPGGSLHHHHHAAGGAEHDRLRHAAAGGGRRPAHPPPVAAGRGLCRALCAVARHGEAAGADGPQGDGADALGCGRADRPAAAGRHRLGHRLLRQ